MTAKADKQVDARYGYMRGRFGTRNAQANGYRFQRFFEREQRVVTSELTNTSGPLLDIACGSGLMVGALEGHRSLKLGLDFNADACLAAQQNGMTVMRGDAFNIPLADGTVGCIVNCQFLNQQTPENAKIFVNECARILRPGGRLIILWRHARSFVHQSAHAVLTLLDQFSGQPSFPQFTHPHSEICDYGREAGLIIEKQAVTLPALGPDTVQPGGLTSNVFGASLLLVASKP